jgi:hypothetical protein
LKLLKENIGKDLKDIVLGNTFLNGTAAAQEIRARIEKLNCIKLKSFYTTKETNTRTKRKPIEW